MYEHSITNLTKCLCISDLFFISITFLLIYYRLRRIKAIYIMVCSNLDLLSQAEEH